ncbi:hypothetical protein Taro_024711 [Colocasia esculenta]|uniref:Uncharacterized protein n=1 Tax=Colocasia esculenta TaxID=4460 RepID=A0A843VA56_COLES|nr:hypothetical protein [Colocasia esculenta]
MDGLVDLVRVEEVGLEQVERGVCSWEALELLDRGHIVHATITNIHDPEKAGLLSFLDEPPRNLHGRMLPQHTLSGRSSPPTGSPSLTTSLL